MLVIDQFGIEYQSPEEVEEAIMTTRKGCGEQVEDEEKGTLCQYGTLCDFCRLYWDELDKLKADLVDQAAEKAEEAFEEFAKRAKAIGFDAYDVFRLCKENYKNGAYMRDHGLCSERIVENEGVFCPEEVGELCEAMCLASDRHDTNYDELRERGMSKDLARELAE